MLSVAIIYYLIATPILFIMLRSMRYSGKDQHIIHVPTYNEALNNAHRKLTVSDCHTMNDVGIDGTPEDLRRMLS